MIALTLLLHPRSKSLNEQYLEASEEYHDDAKGDVCRRFWRHGVNP